jgi:16S rRNA (guanine527-N7)-methyltransferase
MSCRAPELTDQLPDTALEKLRRYHQLLLEWNPAINLVSPKTLPEAWERHILDSLQLLTILDGLPNQRLALDVGSGGGFPGMVLAIARPDWDYHLVESDRKKIEFLRHVSRETSTPVTLHAHRVESLPPMRPALLTARAFAPLPKLLALTTPHHHPGLTLVLPKGAQAEEELKEAKKLWRFDHKSVTSMTDPQAQILILSAVERLA